MRTKQELKQRIKDNNIMQAELARVLGKTSAGISRMLQSNISSTEKTLLEIDSAIEILLKNRNAQDKGVIILDELSFKNTIHHAVITQFEKIEHEGQYNGDAEELAQKIVELIYEEITETEE